MPSIGEVGPWALGFVNLALTGALAFRKRSVYAVSVTWRPTNPPEPGTVLASADTPVEIEVVSVGTGDLYTVSAILMPLNQMPHSEDRPHLTRGDTITFQSSQQFISFGRAEFGITPEAQFAKMEVRYRRRPRGRLQPPLTALLAGGQNATVELVPPPKFAKQRAALAERLVPR